MRLRSRLMLIELSLNSSLLSVAEIEPERLCMLRYRLDSDPLGRHVVTPQGVQPGQLSAYVEHLRVEEILGL